MVVRRETENHTITRLPRVVDISEQPNTLPSPRARDSARHFSQLKLILARAGCGPEKRTTPSGITYTRNYTLR